MAKKKSKKIQAKKSGTAVATTTYKATVVIAGFLSAESGAVEISAKGGDRRRHAVFSFTAVPASFVTRFDEMAQASSNATTYMYANEPTARQVAERFLQDTLGNAWSLGNAIGSCWTPTGWKPPQTGDRCESYPLLANGTAVSQPLRRYDGSRRLYLRFAVSVDIASL